MKKITTYIVLSLLTFSGCDYLDIKPTQWQTAEDVFSIETRYFQSANYAYSFIQPGLEHMHGSTFLEAAIDDGMSPVTTSNIHKLAQGYITASSPILSCWDNSYQGIRQALFTQKYMREIGVVISGQTEEESVAVKQQYIAEMDALRAWFEFCLLRLYGGYPIVDRVYDVSDEEPNHKGRDSFEDCVNHIVMLCDQAAEFLDVIPIGGENGGRGRMNKGIALAIKAKTLVYAASPLYNQAGNSNALLGYTDNNSGLSQRWQSAAKACADVLNLCSDGTINPAGTKRYALVAPTNKAPYENLFTTYPNNEYIMVYTRKKDNSMEQRQFPPTLSKSNGAKTVPTQDLVDAFTLANGSDFVRNNWDEPLDPQYNNRDPRFKAIIGYDGCAYNKRTFYTRVNSGTDDALNAIVDHSTTTGYYLAKFCLKTIDFSKASPGNAAHASPLIRLADIYLMYAEAMAQAYGIDADPDNYGLTARAALQTIRTRAGFKAATDKFLVNVSTVDDFIAKVKQERRVELCFEEQRYFDLRRWMDGDKLNRPVHGIRIEASGKNLSYSYFEADNKRKFEDKMYFHPIPLKVILQSGDVIVQNPGW